MFPVFLPARYSNGQNLEGFSEYDTSPIKKERMKNKQKFELWSLGIRRGLIFLIWCKKNLGVKVEVNMAFLWK